MPPLPNIPTSRESPVAEHLAAWAHEGCSLSDLLVLSSDMDDPPWLALCEHLASPTTVSIGQLAHDPDHVNLERLRKALWAPHAPQAIELDTELFRPDGYAVDVPHETQLRAIAIAEWARQRFDFPSDRKQPWDNPIDAELHPLERVLLERYWVRASNRLKHDDATQLTVLLVNDRAPVDERGRLCRLRLWKVDLSGIPGGAAWHGAVVRAPAAMLLTLKGPDPQTGEMNDSFERALRKLEDVLKFSLAAPGPDGKGACALAWSLQPVMMNRERADGQVRGIPWGMAPVTGGSATLPFALGALVLLRNALKPEHLTLREHLRAIDPKRLAMSAAFQGDVPPAGVDPLDWPLEPIRGLSDKLGAFVLGDLHQSAATPRKHLVLVAEKQTEVPVTDLKVEYPGTLREAVEIAARHAQSALPPEVQPVLDHLLGQAHRLAPLDRWDTPPSPQLTPAQLNALRSAEALSDWPPGEHRAIQFHLLQRYAVWAGGEHLLWGKPVQLTSGFASIELAPDALMTQEEREKEKHKTARSLYELLHLKTPESHHSFVQPRVWVLTAPPAAGKTTLMAEFEMHMAWRALCHHAQGPEGHFGELPLWVPASGLDLVDPSTNGKLSLRAAIADWVRRNCPGLGRWPELLNAPNFKIRLLLDGVNELPCRSEERQDLLSRWLDQDYPQGHRHLPPLITVRTLEKSFSFPGDRQARLREWDEGQRDHYIQQRLKERPDLLAAMRAAVEQDAVSVSRASDRMLYSSPGMLSLGCTLMEQGLLPAETLNTANGPTVNRARLLATYVWSLLLREKEGCRLPLELLGPEERERLNHLKEDLRRDCWVPPEEPGTLLAALREQAWAMQPQVQLPEADWFKQREDRRTLLAVADHLSLVGKTDEQVVGGRKHLEYRWRHHLLMEWFAAYGLGPDELPAEATAPLMVPVQKMYAEWKQARIRWRAEHAERERAEAALNVYADDEDDTGIDGDGLPADLERFQLPIANVCDLEEPIKLAAQLRGTVEDWVSRLIKAGNAPLAARVVLENWSAFGEPVYPQEDPLGPWREGAHPVLKDLREALHERMFDKSVHISQRVEAGDLQGMIGGSPLFTICGQALILRDEYWVQIGRLGGAIDFEMGDLMGDHCERTEAGALHEVKDLRAFRMAGYLVTNAQYRCFVQSGNYGDPSWWLEDTWSWIERVDAERPSPWSIQRNDSSGLGLAPVCCSFWQAQAYARWERAQRERFGATHTELCLPTEAQWEGAARWTVKQGEGVRERWRFIHKNGSPLTSEELQESNYQKEFADVEIWDLNTGRVIGDRSSPVGVFGESNSLKQDLPAACELTDMGGNVQEWCASGVDPYNESFNWLTEAVEQRANDGEYVYARVLRGGSFNSSQSDCRIGARSWQQPEEGVETDRRPLGFRLVLQAGLPGD